MKINTFVLAVLLTFGFMMTARSQCMSGKGATHQHGNSKNTHAHEKSDTSVADKGYTFINDEGNQGATVIVDAGYHPNVLVVKKGIPLIVQFEPREDNCTATVVIKDFGIERKLVPNKLTAVTFTPDRAGSFKFTCPMNMIEGTLVVRE